MANSVRRKLDASGRMFMPRNMDIAQTADNFMTTPKLFALAGVLCLIVVWILWASSINLTFIGYVLTGIIVFFVSQWVIRYIIFQEKYYYKIWQRDKEIGNPTASIFWNVSSVRTSPLGDVLVFSDLKMGCVIELEKDTIIGRASDNMERHYDAWSEFYKTLNLMGYGFVQMNIMEPAGKDVRLNELSKIAQSSDNAGIRLVLETSVGYMKEISRATLNERDYVLIYTKNMNRMDNIVSDVIEASGQLLNGSYAAVRILSAKQVFDIMKDMWNVSIFNGIEAQMEVYRHTGQHIPTPFKLDYIYFGEDIRNLEPRPIEVTPTDEKRLQKASKLLSNGRISASDWDIRTILNGKYDSIDLDEVLDANYRGDIEKTLDEREERKQKQKELQEERLAKAKATNEAKKRAAEEKKRLAEEKKQASKLRKSKGKTADGKNSQEVNKKINQQNMIEVEDDDEEDDDYDFGL